MVEANVKTQDGTLEEQFLKLEKRVTGYEDFLNCEERHFRETLELFN